MSEQVQILLEQMVGKPENMVAEGRVIQNSSDFQMSVNNLLDSTLNCERIRDQYVIHLQQCQNDFQILQNIYKTLKHHVEVMNGTPTVLPNAPVAVSKIEMVQLPIQNSEIIQVSSNTKASIAIYDSFTISGNAGCMRFMHDGKTLLITDQLHNLYFIDIQRKMLTKYITLEISSLMNPIHFEVSPNDQIIAVSGNGSEISLIDISNEQFLASLVGHAGIVTAFAFSPDQKQIISGGIDGTIRIWSMETFHCVNVIQPPIEGAHFTNIVNYNNRFYISLSSGIVLLVDDFNSAINAFDTKNPNLTDLAINESGIISAGSFLKIWELQDVAICKATFTGHADIINSVISSQDSPLVISGSRDASICVWDQTDGSQLFKIPAHHSAIISLQHNPTSHQFASLSIDGHVIIWDYSYA